MARQKFGGFHTEKKLEALEGYMRAYTTALQKQPFKLAFFDAFAGTGKVELPIAATPLFEAEEAQKFIEGSAVRALRCEPCFDEYTLVEMSSSKSRELQKLKEEFPGIADRINVKHGDANIELQHFCRSRDWSKWRAVVFLDPFGNQVSWDTIKEIAATNAIDLWYLFPAGPGVHRQISDHGIIHATHEESLDRLLGTTLWRSHFVEQAEIGDLFEEGKLLPKKTATVESITDFMIQRMKEVFKGGVLDEWLPLSTKGIKYSLIFASANPSPKAWLLASRLAGAVLRRQKRGRAK